MTHIPQKKRYEPPPTREVVQKPAQVPEEDVEIVGSIVLMFGSKGEFGHKREGLVALEHVIGLQKLCAQLTGECLTAIQQRETQAALIQQEAERNFLKRANILNTN